MAHTLDSPKFLVLSTSCVEKFMWIRRHSLTCDTRKFQIEMVAIALTFAYGDLRKLNEELHENA